MQITLKKEGAPVYLQIAEQIREAVKRGDLAPGERLATVRELADTLGIARGTVKHAYDELMHEGTISMARGRGTFVREKESQGNRKEVALRAIDRLLDELESVHCTPQEIELLVKMKLQEREKQENCVRILLVDCNIESLALMQHRLEEIPQVSLELLRVEDIDTALEAAARRADLVVTTSTHHAQVSLVMNDESKLISIALSPSRQTVLEVAKICPEHKVGIWCATQTFAYIISSFLRECGVAYLPKVQLFGRGEAEDFPQQMDVLIVPKAYFCHASAKECEAIVCFEEQGKHLILFDYQIDAGSLIRLEEAIEAVHRAHQ